MPSRTGLSSNAWSSSRAIGRAFLSAASTIYLDTQSASPPFGLIRILVHDGVDTSTIPLPHGTEAWLTTQVPASSGQFRDCNRVSGRLRGSPFQGDMTSLDSLHVEANGRDGAGWTKRVSNPLTPEMGTVTAYSMVNSPPYSDLDQLGEHGSMRNDLQPRLAKGMFCQRSASRSWLCPSPSPFGAVSRNMSGYARYTRPSQKSIRQRGSHCFFSPMQDSSGTGRDRTGRTRTGARASHRCF